MCNIRYDGATERFRDRTTGRFAADPYPMCLHVGELSARVDPARPDFHFIGMVAVILDHTPQVDASEFMATLAADERKMRGDMARELFREVPG